MQGMTNTAFMNRIPHDKAKEKGSKRRRLNAESNNSSEPNATTLGGTYREVSASSGSLCKSTDLLSFQGYARSSGVTRLNDGGIVTHGVGSLVFQVLKKGRGDTGNRVFISNETGVVHISQSDSWSCGYRCAQMVLSYLLPLLKQQKESWSAVNGAYEVIDLTMDEIPLKIDPTGHSTQAQSALLSSVDVPPVISTIQEDMEKSWAEGFDPRGAAHYKYRIRNSNARIGAVEVATLLRYWLLDATIVQFVKVASSRRMLGPFVWTYFAINTLSNRQEENVHQVQTAADILKLAQQRRKVQDSRQLNSNINSSACCPLYLQWEGHSVLVVGIESCYVKESCNQKTMKKSKLLDSMALPKDPGYNLLVFDPSNNCCSLMSALKRYIDNSDEKCLTTILNIIRLPVDRLNNKDIQIIHCSPRFLSYEERFKWREDICAITAVGYET